MAEIKVNRWSFNIFNKKVKNYSEAMSNYDQVMRTNAAIEAQLLNKLPRRKASLNDVEMSLSDNKTSTANNFNFKFNMGTDNRWKVNFQKVSGMVGNLKSQKVNQNAVLTENVNVKESNSNQRVNSHSLPVNNFNKNTYFQSLRKLKGRRPLLQLVLIQGMVIKLKRYSLPDFNQYNYTETNPNENTTDKNNLVTNVDSNANNNDDLNKFETNNQPKVDNVTQIQDIKTSNQAIDFYQLKRRNTTSFQRVKLQDLFPDLALGNNGVESGRVGQTRNMNWFESEDDDIPIAMLNVHFSSVTV